MLTRLKRAGRSRIALIWAMAAVFALAPALSMAYAAPVGAFSRSLVHAHADGDEYHVHDGHHHHHGHDHDGQVGHQHDGPGDDGQNDDLGQPRLHVHYDACCPSVLIPAQTPRSLELRTADRIAILPVEPMQGAPPGCLLRPPIPSSVL